MQSTNPVQMLQSLEAEAVKLAKQIKATKTNAAAQRLITVAFNIELQIAELRETEAAKLNTRLTKLRAVYYSSKEFTEENRKTLAQIVAKASKLGITMGEVMEFKDTGLD